MTEFTHETIFLPARESNNVGGKVTVHIYWVCRGPEGAVTLSVMTNWLKSEDAEIGLWREHSLEFMRGALPTGVAGHFSTKATDDETYREDCVITGGECYSSGDSSIYASEVFAKLTIEGGDAVWPELEAFYETLIEERNEA